MQTMNKPEQPLPFPSGKSLALAIIAGNVENYIERFLKSFSALTPHLYVVRACGANLPDRTLDLARELGAVTAVYENAPDHAAWPHVDDFGAARQMAFDLAMADGHEFLMWADTDDVIDAESVKEIRALLTERDFDCLYLPYRLSNNNLAPVRERIVRAGAFRWQDPIHESLRAVIENPVSFQGTAEITHLPVTHREDRPNERNIRILESMKDPSTGGLLPRWSFYLCQEYEVTGRMEEAISTALQGIKGWQADRTTLQTCEAYELYLMLARWATDGDAKLALLREAWALEPWRREALALMSAAHADQGNAKETLALARMTVSLPEPRERPWTHRGGLYKWSGIYLYSMALRMNGHFAEADNIELQMFRNSGGMISVIHPTRGRPEQATRVRSRFLERARHPERIEYIFAFSEDDLESASILGRFRHVITPSGNLDLLGGTMVINSNAAYRAAEGQIIVAAQDDIEPPFWWDESVVNEIRDVTQPVVLGVRDGHREDGLMVTHIFTRPVPALLGLSQGEYLCSEYRGMYSDTEFSFRAAKAGLVRPTSLTFTHHHAFFGKAQMDATYEAGNKPEAYAYGEEIMRRRNPDYFGPTGTEEAR